jgi:hypothetical protein
LWIDLWKCYELFGIKNRALCFIPWIYVLKYSIHAMWVDAGKCFELFGIKNRGYV